MRSRDLSKPRDRIVILLFNASVLGKPTSIINCFVLLTWVPSVFQSRINYSTTLYVLFFHVYLFVVVVIFVFFFGILRKTNTQICILMHYNNDIEASNSPLIIYSLLTKVTTSIILLTKQFLFVIPITLHCAALFQS